jgi:hypothetical protein
MEKSMQPSSQSRRWYSPRGARRGLAIATLTAVAWLGWAVGYLQHTQPPARLNDQARQQTAASATPFGTSARPRDATAAT